MGNIIDAEHFMNCSAKKYAGVDYGRFGRTFRCFGDIIPLLA